VPKRRLAAEPIELPVRRQENLLQEVLRIGGIPQHPAGDAEQLSRVRPVELLKGPKIAAAAAFNESHILRPREEAAGFTVILDVATEGPRCLAGRAHDAAQVPVPVRMHLTLNE
jgi:hypothetical protein